MVMWRQRPRIFLPASKLRTMAAAALINWPSMILADELASRPLRSQSIISETS